MGFTGELTGFTDDLMGFSGDFTNKNADSMELHGDFMGIFHGSSATVGLFWKDQRDAAQSQ